METKIANYRIIVEPEIQNGKKVYNVYCPTLMIADYGETIEQALNSIKEGIELALESLVEDGEEIPVDNLVDQLITSIPAKLPQ